MDNYIGRAAGKKDEVIIPAKEQESPADEEHDEAKSYYYPPDEDEPQEIREMEEKFQQAVDLNNKLFGTPVFQYEEGIRKLCSDTSGDDWEMLTPARPLDITHTVDAKTGDNLLLEIIDDPPVLPPQSQEYPNTPINVNISSEEV
jgi:hypothetical protein